MATQYNGGQTAGQVLTAATMNSIGAVWETWTPTITATAGTITSGTVNLARYARIQKNVIVRLDYTITNIGSATGASLNTTLPVTPLATYPIGACVGTGREFAIVGFDLQTLLITNNVRISKYDGGNWTANGYGASVIFIYEAA